jgi:hypothetical protein
VVELELLASSTVVIFTNDPTIRIESLMIRIGNNDIMAAAITVR